MPALVITEKLMNKAMKIFEEAYWEKETELIS
jgi:hypothetical protein